MGSNLIFSSSFFSFGGADEEHRGGVADDCSEQDASGDG